MWTFVVKWRFCHVFFVSIIAVPVFSIRPPEQIHISFGDKHTSIVIMWASHDHVSGSVQYGVQDGVFNESAGSGVIPSPATDPNAAGFIHRAVLQGLRPGTRYYYKVVSVCPTNTTDRSESSIYDFNTVSPKQIGVSRFLVYGDMGAGLNIPTYGPLEKYIRSRDYSAIWHVGDLAYDLHSENGKTGDLFLQRIQPFAAYVPYMTLPGNHEIPMHFHHYRARFSTPGNPWPIPINRMWYSYDVGLVHFVSFSTEVYFTYEGVFACEQFYWLLHDLQVANQNREKTPWIVAMGHRPMYCSNRGGDDCTNTHTNRWVKHGTHYKRNLTVHNRDMHAVEELHPAIYQEFAHGHFVGQKTCHAFSSIALDQVYEQLIGELKGNGAGVIGLTVNPSELRRYLIASHMSLNNQLKVQTNGIMNSTLSFNVTSRQISKQWWMNVSTLETPSLKIPVS